MRSDGSGLVPIRGVLVSLVGFALAAGACSGSSTESDSSPAVSSTVDSVKSSTTLATATTSDAPLQSTSAVPGWAVEAQFSPFMSAASAWFGCDFIFDTPGEPVGPAVVVTELRGQELNAVERGMVVSLCLSGFSDSGSIVVTLADAAGRQERLERVADGNGHARISRLVEIDHPLGRWTIRAEQDGRVAELSLQVGEATTPRAVVVPMSNLDDFLVAYPLVSAGASHYVLFTGFEGGEQIVTRLYSGLSNSASYDREIEVEMDGEGSSLLEIATRSTDRDTWFCLALEPDTERRLFPGRDPAQYGETFCFDNPFTTEYATAAIEAIFCDGLRCVDYFDEEALDPPTWHVVGVTAEDPDGGLNVRLKPQQATDNISAVLRWDASGLAVEDQQGSWSEISIGAWADDAYLEPDLIASCPPGLIALRVVGVTAADPNGGLIVTSQPGGDAVAVYKWNAAGICGAENRHPEGLRQVRVQGWVASEFLSQS